MYGVSGWAGTISLVPRSSTCSRTALRDHLDIQQSGSSLLRALILPSLRILRLPRLQVWRPRRLDVRDDRRHLSLRQTTAKSRHDATTARHAVKHPLHQRPISVMPRMAIRIVARRIELTLPARRRARMAHLTIRRIQRLPRSVRCYRIHEFVRAPAATGSESGSGYNNEQQRETTNLHRYRLSQPRNSARARLPG